MPLLRSFSNLFATGLVWSVTEPLVADFVRREI